MRTLPTVLAALLAAAPLSTITLIGAGSLLSACATPEERSGTRQETRVEGRTEGRQEARRGWDD